MTELIKKPGYWTKEICLEESKKYMKRDYFKKVGTIGYNYTKKLKDILMQTYACGHINPDSDSIVSAISLSYLKTQLGEACTPARQGEISPETEFILKTFGLEKPLLKNDFSGDNLYITDYSDYWKYSIDSGFFQQENQSLGQS